MNGNHIKVWVNDIPKANVTNNKYSKAVWIGFKTHAVDDKPNQETLKIEHKNIRIIDKHPEKYARDTDIPLVITL